jgi:predicted nucleic acid-binding protein
MSFVVDASIAASWFLPDEATPSATALARRAAREYPTVPSLFVHEMRNLLVMALRRGRVSETHVRQQFKDLEKLRKTIADPREPGAILRLAVEHRLTGYDATYLALAVDKGLPLATLDKPLAAAAIAERVLVLGPLAP